MAFTEQWKEETGPATPAKEAAERWGCVLIGAEPLLVECAEILLARGHAINAVVSDSAPLRDWAKARALRLIDPPGALSATDLGPFEFLFSIANLDVLGRGILALPSRAAINFHDAPLPAYAGLNTPSWALLNGETNHGVTWHLMTDQIDAGAILATRSFAVDEDETAHSLNAKCFAAGVESFAEMVDQLASRPIHAQAKAQAAPIGRAYKRADRPAAAATIFWDQPATSIHRLIRALDFGGHANPLGCAKILLGRDILLVTEARLTHQCSGAPPGTIVGATRDGLRVATGSDDLMLCGLATASGDEISVDQVLARFSLVEGVRLAWPDTTQAAAMTALDRALAPHESWWRHRLRDLKPLALSASPAVNSAAPDICASDLLLGGAASATMVIAVLAGWLGRVTDTAASDLGYCDPALRPGDEALGPWIAPQLPLHVAIDWQAGPAQLADQLSSRIEELHRRRGYGIDLIARCPELKSAAPRFPVAVAVVDDLGQATLQPGTDLLIAVQSDGTVSRWLWRASAWDAAFIASLQQSVGTFLDAAMTDPARPLGELPVLTSDQRRELECWNATAAAWREDMCVHQLFEEQVARTPEAPAVTSRGVTLSYAALDARSNRLARLLIEQDIGPDMLVGIHLPRSIDLLVAVIAVHKAGGAYVPLDPAYPAARLEHMLTDSGARVVLTTSALPHTLPESAATIVRIDQEQSAIAAQSADPIGARGRPDNLAYVIYTSGSTGLPKGVMVEHRNVVNFFAGMDRVIEPGGTWLAVTSLSFDISVLELCWTVARGCHVVVATGDEATATPTRPIEFSLFYFGSSDAVDASDQYRLLIEGARFADGHGFAAVWTPERHFHPFGGLYPNPAVTGAALAAVTKRVAIRAGSVVLPLHHPIRIAEEWALVDNLSAGRVGIAFASGWQPNDFVLRPEAFADKTDALMRGIDDVRALWRGEKRAFPGPGGALIDIATYPRPVQAELPLWISAAGNPATFAAAGRAGAFVLTHLLGQTVEELTEKLSAYRSAWRDAGHAGEGHVTVMLHSFVGDDREAVRAAVRAPMISYLRTATNLVRDVAWSFPAFRRPGMEKAGDVDLAGLDPADLDALLEHAFDRYFDTHGLFGTPADCLAMVDQLRAAGVDEIGCLIDFGVPADQVLAQLPALDALRELAVFPSQQEDLGLPALMECHGVTHLQCTPSMAQMLVSDPAARAALGKLRHLMIGGEALPPALAASLAGIVPGTVTNMYGPTETTIWSAVHRLDGRPGPVPIGRPLANQQIYIVDSRQQLVPPGMPGELLIAGKGVTRGYLGQPALTAQRFLADPFDPGGRAYRTGDLARQRADGTIEFLGRLDHQVKIRGHRIELGEIEAVLEAFPGVIRAVAVAREDTPGDVRLVAYYVADPGRQLASDTLHAHLTSRLPDVMVPAHLLALPELPQTPNGKVDRAALPAPDHIAIVVDKCAFVAPANELEQRITAIWSDVLKLRTISTRDNFFDLGGHSLLAVQVHRRLADELGRTLPLTDIFRFPTVSTLAAHLSSSAPQEGGALQGQARAEGRRTAIRRRLGLRFASAGGEG